MPPTICLAEPGGSRRDHRASERRRVAIPGRLVWRDAHNATRFATVVIRNASEHGVFVECLSGTPIPLYRLVVLQAERSAGELDSLPDALRHGRVLSAVYRVERPDTSSGAPQGYALRMLVEPRRRRPSAVSISQFASADASA